MHLKALVLATLTLLPFALGQPACKADDIPCYVTSAQYTILGNVVSSNANLPPGSSANYNATIAVKCVYASYNTTLNTGANILNESVVITRFGQSTSKCPTGGGATATPGQTAIFFVHVANTPALGTTPILSVFDVCTGGLNNTDSARQQIATVLAKSPDYGFYGAQRGANCTLPGLPTDFKPLPSPSPSPSPTSSPTATATAQSQSGTVGNRAVSGFVGMFALVLGVMNL
ncbi:hypothetical protein HDV00_000128 [Rhizophlyctis rosea]|nr:hypothetical protein HDV00_000128 [Rhizophlyctis rosea]